MTPEHKKYLNYNEAKFTTWGRSVGKHTATVVRYFLTNGKETEQGYKACASMTKLADHYGAVRLENGGERLLAFTSTPTIRTLSTIHKNEKDKIAAPKKQEAFYEAYRMELTHYEAAGRYLDGVMNGRTGIPLKAWKAEREKLTAERKELSRRLRCMHNMLMQKLPNKVNFYLGEFLF